MLTRIALALLLLGVFPAQAMAHKIIVNAWVEDGYIVTETAFGDGNSGKTAKVTVANAATGETILQGEADEQGVFEAALPDAILQEAPDLRVVTDAGMGHQAETNIPGADYARVEAPTPAATPVAGAASSDGGGGPAGITGPAEGVGVDMAQLQAIIRPIIRPIIRAEVQEAVRKEVQPLKREIQALRDAGPGATEIMGGVGYILGLAGLAILLKQRKAGA